MIRNFTSVTKVYASEDSSVVDCYKVIENGVTSFVPNATDNKDYQAIQEWISEGNTVIDNPPE